MKHNIITDSDKEPKLLIERIGERTHLGVLWFFILWYIGYFILIEIIMPIIVIKYSIISTYNGIIQGADLIDSIITYTDISAVFLNKYFKIYMNWNVMWAVSLYITFYFRKNYLDIINKLFKENKIDRMDYDALKCQLLNRYYIKRLRVVMLFLLLLPIYNTIVRNNIEPTFLWGSITISDLALNHSSLKLILGPEITFANLSLILNLLHWIPGVIVQLFIFVDFIVMGASFIFLIDRLLHTIVDFDLFNADRLGGLRFIGDIYFRIVSAYILGLLFFIIISYLTYTDMRNHDPILEITQYLVAITLLSVTGLLLFIYPQSSMNKLFNDRYRQYFQEMIDYFRNLESQSKRNDDYYLNTVCCIRLILLLNDVEKLNTYAFGKNNTIKIIIATIFANVISAVIQLQFI